MAKVKNKNTERNYALPGEPLSQKEFENMVKEAEKGPFYPIESLKEVIDKWKAKKRKK